jgi:phosphoglucomutase
MKFIEKYNNWVTSEYISQQDKAKLIQIKGDHDEIKDRFYKDLEFGTGGLRGIIGIGTNRINIYTVRKATQGFATHLLRTYKNADVQGVVIAYDSRHYSDVFAKEAALVLAGNGIKCYLFESLRSTPELSFAVRHMDSVGGIVITASHNPSEYNGYKVYNEHGGQITLDYAKSIISEINKIVDWNRIKYVDESQAIKEGLLEIIGTDVDEKYIDKVVTLIQSKRVESQCKDFKIVYTPLHGTGLMPVTACLERLGYRDIHIVESQAIADGGFPTVKSPNPEEHDAFKEGIKLAKRLNADIVLGTDPDCDRVGVVVKDDDGNYIVLSGYQVGALLVKYMMNVTANINEKHVVIKTIVTSDLGATIAKAHGSSIINTLTGFKYIGEQIQLLEQEKSREFLFGYEESYGYLTGTFVRDKDAVIACSLIVEMASLYKKEGKSLYDALQDIYEEYGFYFDTLETFVFKGLDGQKQMKSIMGKCRKKGELYSAFENVQYVEDYMSKTTQYANGECKVNIQLPITDVIKIIFEDHSWIAIRPSGTEPKLKVYYSVLGDSQAKAKNKFSLIKNQLSNFLNI